MQGLVSWGRPRTTEGFWWGRLKYEGSTSLWLLCGEQTVGRQKIRWGNREEAGIGSQKPEIWVGVDGRRMIILIILLIVIIIRVPAAHIH